MKLSGVSPGARFTVEDDGIMDFREVWELTPPVANVSWMWDDGKADGMVLGPLGTEFEMTAYPQFTSGITAVKFLSGGLASPQEVDLNLIDPIIIKGTPNEPPRVLFAIFPARPHINELITFDARATFDPDGAITEYAWDFNGDGSFDLSTEDPVMIHSYSTGGIKHVMLRATDAEGARARYTYDLDVFP